MFGLRGLQIDTGYNGQWPWLLLIGLAFGLVIVASTQAIVGNAPREQGGIAGGLQSTANQLGGVLGTSILGSLIVSSVGGVLVKSFTDAGVPLHMAQQLSTQKELIAQGIAPIPPGTPAAMAAKITTGSYEAFLHGLHFAMLIGAFIAIFAALLALLIKRGHEDAGAVHAGM
jgi:hypothetical protein